MNANTKNLVKSNAIWLVFIAEVIIFSIASGGTFITGSNIVNISRQVSYYGIASIGMTFVILIAGIDLSIGSIITCVVLGGVSVNGGVGRMSGVVAGVLIIGSLTNGMILMDVSEYTQMVVKGLVLAVAVGIDCMSKKSQST